MKTMEANEAGAVMIEARPVVVRRPAREQDPDDLLHALVAMPSVSGSERGVAELLVTRMQELGMSARIDGAGNAVGEIGPARGPGVREIVMLGHIDTVPGEIRVRREGDLLYGRGSVDAKGPLAAFVMAAATAELGRGVRVVVIGAVEEEVVSSKGARYAAMRHRPELCIIGEPSGADGFVLGYKGRLLMEASAEVSGSHSAGPAATAAEEVAGWWQRVQAQCAAMNVGRVRVFDQVQARLRGISSGGDGLREMARAQIGFRLPSDVGPDEMEGVLRRLRSVSEAGVRVRFSGHEEAYLGERHSELTRLLSVAIREEMGVKPRVAVKTGTSDMNVVGPLWRCPIVAYGPGDSALDHTPDEHISMTEYRSAIGVLRRVLEGV